MLEITFTIKNYMLEDTLTDDEDYLFLERIGERYDYMLFQTPRMSSCTFKISLHGEYNTMVAIKDILNDLRCVEVESFSFRFSFDKPSQRS